jgi:hypothetical protein
MKGFSASFYDRHGRHPAHHSAPAPACLPLCRARPVHLAAGPKIATKPPNLFVRLVDGWLTGGDGSRRRSDNQDEREASIRMRARRGWTAVGRAMPSLRQPAPAAGFSEPVWRS